MVFSTINSYLLYEPVYVSELKFEYHCSIHYSGADISIRDNDEMTPLMLAIKAGNIEIITVMLDLGCDIHSEAKHEKSLIVWAIENEYTALLKV